MNNTLDYLTALYMNQLVIIEEVILEPEGNMAFISHKDGSEEYVPLSSLDFLK